ncbi:hypothetical protein A0H81_03655, partial [Grifola frondosa]
MACSDISDDDSDSYSVASSATSYDWEMHSTSLTPSIYSVTSSLRAAAYRFEHRRVINNYSEVYYLPADDEEFRRLDQQRMMFMEVIGKYPLPPVATAVADDTQGVLKACADLGCGSCSCSHAGCLSALRCSLQEHASKLQVRMSSSLLSVIQYRGRSEVDDVNFGIQHYYGDFNVVHARLISSGIRDYKGLVDQIAQTLRSGGIVDLTEFDFRFCDGNKSPILSSTTERQITWIARWMNPVHVAIEQRGGEPDAANHLSRWVSENPTYEDMHCCEFWFQACPWKKIRNLSSMYQNRVGHTMREDIPAFMKSGRPLLLSHGIYEHTLDEIEANARRELLGALVRPTSESQTYTRVESNTDPVCASKTM